MNTQSRVTSKHVRSLQYAAWPIALVAALSLAACTPSSEPEVTPKPISSTSDSSTPPAGNGTSQEASEPANEQTGQLTVKETVAAEVEADIALAKTEEIADVSVDIWLSSTLAIVSAENKNLPKFDNYQTGMVYPRSLYTYDIESKAFTPLLEKEGVHLWSMELSPDRRHLIYSEFVVGDALLSVLDIATKETTELTSTWGANWLNDTTIIGQYYGESRAYTQELGGKKKSVKELDGKVGLILLVSGNDVYLSDPNGKLLKYNTSTRKVQDLGVKNPIELKASADGELIALTRFSGQESYELVVCDRDCANPTTVATSGGSFAWSPNSKMLAFADADGSDTGAYVYDLARSNTTQISVGTEFGKIAWSESNETLSLATYSDNEDGLKTLIAHLTGESTE